MKTIIPTAVLQEVMDAMDDMATDSRLLDMKQSRVHGFDAARDALRFAMQQQNHHRSCSNSKTVTMPREVAEQALESLKNSTIQKRDILSMHKKGLTIDAIRAALRQPDPAPYLWYDPRNGDTWTQEAIDEGFCATDGLIPLYTKDEK